MLDGLIARGMRFDAALAIWVLQHCADPAGDIARLRGGLNSGGSLFVANAIGRSVPTVEKGWLNDGLDVKAMLAAEFDLRQEGGLALEKTTEVLAAGTYWASFRQRG
jgi:hypothetical protein